MFVFALKIVAAFVFAYWWIVSYANRQVRRIYAVRNRANSIALNNACLDLENLRCCCSIFGAVLVILKEISQPVIYCVRYI